MEEKIPVPVRSKSDINYNYASIKITTGRLKKGLIAFPRAMAYRFPEKSGVIKIVLGNSNDVQEKPYSSYLSRTHEGRINGLRDWFKRDNIKEGNEIVIQFIDEKNNIYRLIKESDFIGRTKEIEKSLDNSVSGKEAIGNITTLADWTISEKREVFLREYSRLALSLPFTDRRRIVRNPTRVSEKVPAGIKTILSEIYGGHCQVCDFSFFNRYGKPYFETHHLDPLKGHHLKNIVVVCGNCHNEFEYANVKPQFDYDTWLVNVAFNDKSYTVKQAIFDLSPSGFYKETYSI